MGAVGELNDILQRLEVSLGPIVGEPTPLEGGITNRNFRVGFAGGEYVVRLHGKDTDLLGISRAAERIAGEAAAGLGVGPPVVADFDGALVTGFVACDSLQSAQIAQSVGEIARALRAFHDSRTLLPVGFRVPELLSVYAEIVLARGGELPDIYGEAVEIAARLAAALPTGSPCPCHNDLLPGNIIRSRSGRMMLVDWEYAGMGHRCFDLGNLSVNNDFDEATDELLLSTYYGAPPTSAQVAELRLMRVLSDIREAAWGVMQAQISELDFDFDGYAELHFARMRSAAVGADFEDWLTAAEG